MFGYFTAQTATAVTLVTCLLCSVVQGWAVIQYGFQRATDGEWVFHLCQWWHKKREKPAWQFEDISNSLRLNAHQGVWKRVRKLTERLTSAMEGRRDEGASGLCSEAKLSTSVEWRVHVDAICAPWDILHSADPRDPTERALYSWYFRSNILLPADKADDFTETVKEATAFSAPMGTQKENSDTHRTMP